MPEEEEQREQEEESSGQSSGDEESSGGDGEESSSGEGEESSGGDGEESSGDDGDDSSGEEGDDSSGEEGDDSSGDDGGESESSGEAGQKVGDVMASDPVTVEPSASIEEAAEKMKESDVGALLVVDGDELKGIVTDRDIAVDAVGEGEGKVEDAYSSDPATVSPDDDIDKAIELMREEKVRRLPVVEDGKPVGIVSLGDLAIEADEESVLADISEAPPS
jgi:CBS domain-containing protein